MRATFGEQSRNPVLRSFYRQSRSNPDKPPYEIQLHNDGVLTCNCRGWTTKKDGQPRSCTHVRELREEAQRYLDARTREPFSTEEVDALRPFSTEEVDALRARRDAREAEARRNSYETARRLAEAKEKARKEDALRARVIDTPKKKAGRKIQLGGDWT